ncbi:MAG: hypothetical protein ACUZ77_06155, partial [Candidatus Brocadiales bacterium]
PPCPAEDCTNGIDDDGDGLVDCNDSDCPPCSTEDCTNGTDDDGDGLVDCLDPDCLPCPAEDCTNGIDDDGDGLVDCNDTDCPSCTLASEICSDGIDNDGDGLIDCDDPDCVTDATYSKGKSFIRFNHRKPSKDRAFLRMCINQAFCDVIEEDPAGVEIVLELNNCVPITISGLKPNKKRTKFRVRASTVILKINCNKQQLKLRLKKLDLKACVSNPVVKVCVSVKDVPCLCAEKEFTKKLDKKGRLRKLSSRATGTCSP